MQTSSNQKKTLGVPVSLEDIRKSYGVVSRFYAVAEGIFEKGLRQKGLQLLSVTPGEVVLEIGFGTGYSLKEIANSVGENGRAYGIDITPQMLEITRKRLRKAGLTDRVELYEGDAKSMPYQDNKFDAVYMASTLELFDTPDIPRVLKEVKRVLKPSGRLGIASLTKEGREGSLFLRFYEWLHQKIPKYANCRPIYVEKLVADAGYEITKTGEFVILKLVPWKLLVARPQTDS
jgi:demethylmenaquinone methyltransferase/2-methoxy-6-polyprenyl-1,4-benzoquinol methylase